MRKDWETLPGRLIVVSGPSGSGKSTLVRRAIEWPGVRANLSVSATTRTPRVGEVNGRDYYFLSREEFAAGKARGEFLESAEVHGNFYGTPAPPVREALSAGRCVILEIDVQGAMIVREQVPSALLVFVRVPSLADLEQRLRSRATDSDETIAKRLANARWELEQAGRYDRQILNQDLDRAVAELVELLTQHGCGG
jgi:guanylate kinase